MIEYVVPAAMFSSARRPSAIPIRPWRPVLALAAGTAIVLGLHPMRFGRIIRPGIPVDGVRILRALLPGSARIYNAHIWGGLLILEGDPLWQVAVDGRLYFFRDPAEWKAIEEVQTGRISLDQLELCHNPDAFFL
jgi:hypothetical protein